MKNGSFGVNRLSNFTHVGKNCSLKFRLGTKIPYFVWLAWSNSLLTSVKCKLFLGLQAADDMPHYVPSASHRFFSCSCAQALCDNQCCRLLAHWSVLYMLLLRGALAYCVNVDVLIHSLLSTHSCCFLILLIPHWLLYVYV